MTNFDSLLEFASRGPRRHVGLTFQTLLEKLEEYSSDPDVQLAVVDYWIGLLNLTRSEIQTRRLKT